MKTKMPTKIFSFKKKKQAPIPKLSNKWTMWKKAYLVEGNIFCYHLFTLDI